jgi:hypothetical protein
LGVEKVYICVELDNKFIIGDDVFWREDPMARDCCCVPSSNFPADVQIKKPA